MATSAAAYVPHGPGRTGPGLGAGLGLGLGQDLGPGVGPLADWEVKGEA